MSVTAPTFSVVIPVYNLERYVMEAIQSALSQTRPADEVIVVDDGSTDNSPEVIASFADRIKSIMQENSGVSVTRNKGIEAASGDWICFLDGDDRWKAHHLETVEKAIKDNPDAGMVFSDAIVIGENGKEIKKKLSPDPGPDPFVSLLLRNTITTSACCVKKRIIEKNGGFLKSLKGMEDWDLWLRIAREHEVAHIPQITIDYRKQEMSLVHTRGRGKGMREDNLFVVSRAAALDPKLPMPVLRKARANCYLESAVRLTATWKARSGSWRAETLPKQGES